MWVFLPDGFISAVENRRNTSQLLIRARRREILEDLFPDAELIETPTADYPFRVSFCRVKAAARVCKRMAAIEYHNFKGEVDEPDYLGACHKVWADLYEKLDDRVNQRSGRQPLGEEAYIQTR